jgi:hypothetical protein
MTAFTTELSPTATLVAPGIASPQSETLNRWQTFNKLAHQMAEGGDLPKGYNHPGKVLLALDLSYRLNKSVLSVMQNFKLSTDGAYWTYSALISMVNTSGLYATSLRFEEVGTADEPGYKVRAFAMGKDGQQVNGPFVTQAMATLGGWSQTEFHQSAPEVSMKGRAAGFFARLNCPEVTEGFSCEGTELESNTVSVNPGAALAIAATAVGTVNAATVLPTGQTGDLLDAIAIQPAVTKAGIALPAGQVDDLLEGFAVKPAALPAQPLESPVVPLVTTELKPAKTARKSKADAAKDTALEQSQAAAPSTPAEPAVVSKPPQVAVTAKSVDTTFNLDKFDQAIGQVTSQEEVTKAFALLAKVDAVDRAEAEILLVVRLCSLFDTFLVATEQVGATLTWIFNETLATANGVINGMALTDLAAAYNSAANRLWPASA